MSPLLLLTGLTLAAATALLTVYTVTAATVRTRAVRARIASGNVGLSFNPGTVLRRERASRFPLAALLPVSPEARDRMSRELEQAGWAIRVGEYLALRFVSACTAALIGVFLLAYFHVDVLPLRVAAVIALFFSGWLLPRLYLSRRRQRRLEQIEKQLPDALTTMAKSLRAGTGLLQALAYAANETPPPLGPELQSALRDLQLGAEAEDVFGALSERIGSPDLDIAVTAIVIQRTVGGNLAEILTKVTETIRERTKLYGEVRVLTAQQRLTGNLVALIPILVAVGFFTLKPELGRLLIETSAGQVALAIGIAFELLGLWLIRRLAVIEV